MKAADLALSPPRYVLGMKAVVFAENEVRVDDVPRPRIIEAGDAVVRVTSSSICGSDLHLLDGKTPGMRSGSVIGHEFVGVVEEAGDLAEGTRVVGSFLIACGRCRSCRAGRFNHCDRRRALGLGTLTGDLDGAQAEYVRVPDARVNLKPLDAPEVMADEAALFCGDVLATGLYASDLSGASPEKKVAVIGAGPVGLFSALAVRRAGAEVVVLDLDPERVAFARRTYGLEAIRADQVDPSDLEADAAIEAVGAVPALKNALRAVRDGGTVAVVGVYGAERYQLPLGVVWVRGLELRFAGMTNVHAHWDAALEAVTDGTIDPTAVITHRLPLENAPEGYELFRSRKALKVVLTP